MSAGAVPLAWPEDNFDPSLLLQHVPKERSETIPKQITGAEEELVPLSSTSVPTTGNDPRGSPQQHHRHRRDGSGVAGGSHGTAGEAFPVPVPGFQLRGITSRQGNALLKRRRAPCWLRPEQSTAASPRQPRLCSVIRAGHYPRRAPAAATTKRSQLTIPRVLFGAGAEHSPGPGGGFFSATGAAGRCSHLPAPRAELISRHPQRNERGLAPSGLGSLQRL